MFFSSAMAEPQSSGPGTSAIDQPKSGIKANQMLVVRQTANPDGSSRPVYTIVRKPSSTAASLPPTSQLADKPHNQPQLVSIDESSASDQSMTDSAVYGESFWIDDFGCDTVMEVAPGLARQSNQQAAGGDGSSSSATLTHLVIESGSASSSRLLRCRLGPEGSSGLASQKLRLPALTDSSATLSSGAVSSAAPKMLQCSKCGKHFRNLYSLEHHICGPRRKHLSRQQVQHQEVNGVRYYLCPACRKPFKWIGNLTRHFHTHTGGRFFRCEICAKSFFTSYQVKRHMNSHLGVRYKCTVCAKPFTCKYSCTWHIRQHLLAQQQQQPQPQIQQQQQQQKQQQPSLVVQQQWIKNLSKIPSVNYKVDIDEDDEDTESEEEDNYNDDVEVEAVPAKLVDSRVDRRPNASPASSPVATVTVKTFSGTSAC